MFLFLSSPAAMLPLELSKAVLPRNFDSSGHVAAVFFLVAMLPRKVDSSGYAA